MLFELFNGKYNHLKIEFTNYPGTLFLLFFLIISLIFIALTLLKLPDRTGKAAKFFFLLTSFMILLYFWLILFSPAIKLIERERIKSEIALFFDTSKSIFLKASKDPTKNLADEILSKGSIINELKEKYNVHCYFFSDNFFEGSCSQDNLELNYKKGQGENSLIFDSLYKFNETLVEKKEKLAGTIIFSDGIDSDKENTLLHDQNLGSLGKINFFLYPNKFIDIGISKVKFPELAFLRTPVSVVTTISLKNYPEAENIDVYLKQNNQILTYKTIQTNIKEEEVEVTLETLPQAPGYNNYTIEISTGKFDEILNNNKKNIFVNVVQDSIRILHIAGAPSWDQKFLRETLKTNKHINLISFYILRTLEDNPEASQDDMSLIEFPYQDLFSKELNTFDLVIFQNFDYNKYFGNEYATFLNNISNYVIKGGGFCFIGGNLTFNEGGYKDTVIENLLPVSMKQGRISFRDEKFRINPTEAGLFHPILNLTGEPSSLQQLFSVLPELKGYNLLEKAKEGAAVLATDNNKNPMLACWPFKNGRVFLISTDQLWKWNFLFTGQTGNNQVYHKLWENIIRWLIKDREFKPLKITSSKTSFKNLEEVPLTVSENSENQKIPKTLMVEITNSEQVGKKQLTFELSGKVTFTFLPETAGIYKIHASLPNGDSDEIILNVEDRSNEFLVLTPNLPLLKKIEEKKLGKILSPEKTISDLILDEEEKFVIKGSVNFTLWDGKYSLLFLVALLFLSWILKKRIGFN